MPELKGESDKSTIRALNIHPQQFTEVKIRDLNRIKSLAGTNTLTTLPSNCKTDSVSKCMWLLILTLSAPLKTSPNKLKRTEMPQSMFSEHNGI